MELSEIRTIRKDLREVQKELQRRIDSNTSKSSVRGEYGLCTICSHLFTEAFIKQHKPSIFSKWFWNKSYFHSQHFQYLFGNDQEYHWWDISDGGNKQRIKFIDYLLKQLNKE